MIESALKKLRVVDTTIAEPAVSVTMALEALPAEYQNGHPSPDTRSSDSERLNPCLPYLLSGVRSAAVSDPFGSVSA